MLSLYLKQCCQRSVIHHGITKPQWVNLSPSSATYKRQWIGWALVKIMACRIFSAKPLPKPIQDYYQLDPQEQTSMKFESKYKNFHSRKCIWNYRLRNGGHFVQGGDELMSRGHCRPVNMIPTHQVFTHLLVWQLLFDNMYHFGGWIIRLCIHSGWSGMLAALDLMAN